MEQTKTKYIVVNGPEVESLLDTIENAPKEEQSLMALMRRSGLGGFGGAWMPWNCAS